MAIQVKRIDDWKPNIEGIGRFGGGGGGGLGAIISGAIAAGTTAAIAGSGTTSGSGGNGSIAALPKNPIEGNLPLIESETAGTPQPEQKPEEEKPTPTPIPQPEIKDETSTNVEQAIDNSNALEMLKSLRDEQWAREDAIRAETQAREDTAFSRGITDMRRAGVNVNLVGAQPAESGGGITQATGINYQPYQIEMDKYVSLLEQEIENTFKEDENAKDRFTDIFGNLIQTIVMSILLKR